MGNGQNMMLELGIVALLPLLCYVLGNARLQSDDMDFSNHVALSALPLPEHHSLPLVAWFLT